MIRPAVTIEPVHVPAGAHGPAEDRLKITIDTPGDMIILYVADDTLAEVEAAAKAYRAKGQAA